MRSVFILLCFVGACGKSAPPAPPSSALAPTYAEVVARLPQFLNSGWVITRGTPDNRGDSLLFTGLATYGLSCSDGAPEAAGLEAMLHSGAYYRYPGDPDAISLDGLLGLYRGVAARVNHCAETPRWATAFAAAPAPDSSLLPAGFDYVRQALMARLGGPAADAGLQPELEASAAGWTLAVNAAHAPCFRAHLSLIALQTVEELGGKISATGKAAFCDSSRGLRIATAEDWCGRAPLSGWLGAFQYNVYEYAHQRCPAWEPPDGAGEQQPAVDFLVAYQDQGG